MLIIVTQHALSRVHVDVIANPTSNYVEFKGALAENAALQSLVTIADNMPSYWSSQSKSEVEFVVQVGTEIIPIEVKAEGNISGRSISVYNDKYAPNYRCRFSMLNLQSNGFVLVFVLTRLNFRLSSSKSHVNSRLKSLKFS